MKRLIYAALAVAVLGWASPSSAQDRIRVAIGQRGNWDTIATQFAVDQGIMRRHNLAAEITWTQGGPEQIQAVVTGSADFAIAAGTIGAIAAIARGAPIKMIAAQMTGSPDLFWYTRADSPIQTMRDTADRSVGYSRPGASTDLVVRLLAGAAGVRPRLVAAGSPAANRTQVMSGQLDAGWSSPPFALDLVQSGQARIIARGSDLPQIADQTVRVNIASNAMLTQRRDVARRYLQAYAETLEWMYAHQDDALAAYARFNEIPIEIARTSMPFFPRAAMRLTPISNIQLSIEQGVEFRLLERAIPVAQVEQAMIDYVWQPQ
jgi:NitT/TauT family transport system substrate-binding protein